MAEGSRINLFGEVSVTNGKEEITEFPTVHCKHLLAFLALHSDIQHLRDRLVEELWPSGADRAGRNRLSVTFYLLRKRLALLGDAVDQLFTTTRSTIRLNSGIVQIDFLDFQAAEQSARSADEPSIKEEHLQQLIELYGGPLLSNVRTTWSLARQIESSESYQRAVIYVAERRHQYGQDSSARQILADALDVEPHSERTTELMVTWLTRIGEFDKAILYVRRLKKALAVSGGTLSRRMQQLVEELNSLAATGDVAAPIHGETTVTVLSLDGLPIDEVRHFIELQGGRMDSGNESGLFSNPLQALQSAREILKANRNVSALIHTTIMVEYEPAPSITQSALVDLPRGALYGTASTMELLKTQGIEAESEIKRKIRLFRFS